MIKRVWNIVKHFDRPLIIIIIPTTCQNLLKSFMASILFRADICLVYECMPNFFRSCVVYELYLYSQMYNDI